MASYEIIGSREKAIAIVEIEDNEKKRQKEIANEIMKKHKNVKAVLKKMSERKGVERIRSYRLLAGEKDTRVTHIEYGYKLFLDPRKVYFSPRESTERQRIASLVKEGETVMVMFAGIGPLAIAIGKKQPNVKKIICVEINPNAVKFMKKNVEINKLSEKIDVILGDVKEKCKDYYGKCDRVLMPLPHKSELFLDVALKCLRNGGWIHLYVIKGEEEIKEFAEKISREINAKNFFIKKVLPYAPRVNKYCIDFML
ncbi:MAG: class I SAM-dependent methyltransferase family protein [Candidatus Aenigmarchaeota archaeon]|nr:class I SAM-dependent methyltransferase family protein [Candidatus Aenigmarchaeota archaeon]